VGYTVTVAVVTEVQPVDDVAVIVNTVLLIIVELFVSVPDIVEPVPLNGISPPTGGKLLSLVQEKVVPDTLFGLDIKIGLIDAPVQIV
jgi:hypothetical protein